MLHKEPRDRASSTPSLGRLWITEQFISCNRSVVFWVVPYLIVSLPGQTCHWGPHPQPQTAFSVFRVRVQRAPKATAPGTLAMQKAWQGALLQHWALHTFLIWAKHGTGYLSLSPKLPNPTDRWGSRGRGLHQKGWFMSFQLSHCTSFLLLRWTANDGASHMHALLSRQRDTGCWVLGTQGNWGCFNLILEASLCYFMVARTEEFVHVCCSICLVYSVGNGEEMCFQFHLIYSACLRFYLKLSFLCCSDKKQDFEIKVWVTEKAKVKIELYLQRKKKLFKKNSLIGYEENWSSFFFTNTVSTEIF